jgi:hypothetical protein
MIFNYIIRKHPDLVTLDMNRWLERAPRAPPQAGGRYFNPTPTIVLYRDQLKTLLEDILLRIQKFGIDSHIMAGFFGSMRPSLASLVELTAYKKRNTRMLLRPADCPAS